MGRPADWMKVATGRPVMKSPGKPSLRRDTERAFWREIATGCTSERAAILAGVSQAAGTRWFRDRGGMPTFLLAPLKGRYLSFEEREEIALLNAQGTGVRKIAQELKRSPSTISRELRRNAATRAGKLDYRASVAQWKAERFAQRAAALRAHGSTGTAQHHRPHPSAGRARHHLVPATGLPSRQPETRTRRAAGVSSFLCKGPVGYPVCRVVRSEVGWGIERRKRSVPGASLGCLFRARRRGWSRCF